MVSPPHCKLSNIYLQFALVYNNDQSPLVFFSPVASEEAILKRYPGADVYDHGIRKRQLQFYSSSSLHFQSIFPGKGTR